LHYWILNGKEVSNNSVELNLKPIEPIILLYSKLQRSKFALSWTNFVSSGLILERNDLLSNLKVKSRCPCLCVGIW